MGGTSVTPIVLGFVLGIIPFTLWTLWMIHAERSERASRIAGSTAFTPAREAAVRTASTEVTPPRWRRDQTAA